MKKGILSLIATVVLALACTVPAYADVPWSGAGTESDPYQITNASQLRAVAEQVNSTHTLRGKYFKMTADIDLNNQAFTPIGKHSFPFSGTFDGNGHSITGLKVTAGAQYQTSSGAANSYTGLFGLVGEYASEGHLVDGKETKLYPATIKNLTVKGSVDVSGVSEVSDKHRVGGIVGSAARMTTIENVTTDLSVSGNYYVGGLVGYAELDGYGSGLVISECTVKGTVAGQNNVGGVAGFATGTNSDTVWSISNCEVSATVTATNSSSPTAGIVGYLKVPENGAIISGCIVPGSVTCGSGTPYGLVGDATVSDVKKLVMANSRYLAAVKPYPDNLASATIQNVISATADAMRTEFASLKTATVPGVGSTPDPDQSQNMTINNASDWNTFVQNVNQNGYKYKGKTVTLGTNLNVGSATVGGTVDSSTWAGNYFMGTFDGQGHTITVNVTNGSSWSGLFSFISGSQYGGGNDYATIKNLKLAGTISTGASAQQVGALAGGVGRANITNVTSSVAVSNSSSIAAASVGGMVGRASSYSKINGCTVSGDVTATNAGRVGGIVGSMIYQDAQAPMLTGCSVSGTVNGKSVVGGLIGRCGAVDTAISTNGYRLTLQNCKVDGTVKGTSKVGSLVGEIAKPDNGNVELVKTGTTAAASQLSDVGSFEKNADTGTGGGTGTVLSKPDMTELDASILAAKIERAKAEQGTSIAIGDKPEDVAKDKPYVTSAQLTALADAIASAEKTVTQVTNSKPAKQEEVDVLAKAVADAKASIEKATETFKAAYASQKGTNAEKAATEKRSLDTAKVVVEPLTYMGSALTPVVTVTLDGQEVAQTAYRLVFLNSKGKQVSTVKNAGAYQVIVTANSEAYTGSATTAFSVAKASQKVKAAKAKANLSAKSLKKKNATVNAQKLGKVSAKTTIAYSGKANKQAKKFSINSKNGKITVKKGLKAGTYKFTVSAQAKATSNYKASKVKKFAITIKVK